MRFDIMTRIQANSLRPGGRYIIRAVVDRDVGSDDMVQIVGEISKRFIVNDYMTRGREIYIDITVPEYQQYAIPTSMVASWLPEVFALAGLTMTMMSIYVIFKSVPEWTVIILIIGIALLVLSSNVLTVQLPKIEYKGKRIGGK